MERDREGHYEFFPEASFSDFRTEFVPYPLAVFENFRFSIAFGLPECPDPLFVFEKEVGCRNAFVADEQAIANAFETAVFRKGGVRSRRESVLHGRKLYGRLLFFVAFHDGLDRAFVHEVLFADMVEFA